MGKGNFVTLWLLFFSASCFEVTYGQSFTTTITIANNSNESGTLQFGTDPNGTDGLDFGLGEIPAPPAPPGAFDTRFILPDLTETFKDIRKEDTSSKTYRVQFKAGSGGYPITLSWASGLSSYGAFKLQDDFGGALGIDEDMTSKTTYTITNSGIDKVRIIFKPGSQQMKPTVVTTAATNITDDSAQLNGTVNPNGASASYYFEYGTTTSYGSTTPSSDAGSGSSAVSVNRTISNLIPNTTYHYRLVATNNGGISYGNDFSFTTLEEPSDIAILFPVGSEELLVGGCADTIKWSAPASIQRFKIELSRDGGLTYPIMDRIADIAPNTGKKAWLVKGPASNNCIIKISDFDNPSNYTVIDNNFTISELNYSPGFGRHSICSSPSGAEVFVNDQPWPYSGAVTPIPPTLIAAGDYNLKLTKAGYKDWEGQMGVVEGQTRSIPDAVLLPQNPPNLTSFSINNGTVSTTSQTVSLDNSATNNPTEYKASENSNFSGASWQTYSTAPTFTLSSGFGTKTVYLKVRNAGGESNTRNDAIDYVQTAPTLTSFSINNGASSTTSQTVTLNNSATNSPAEYLASENSNFSGASWQSYTTAPTFALSSGFGTKTVYFKVSNAGGESNTRSDAIEYVQGPFITVTSPVSGDDWQKGTNYSIQWSSNAGGNVRIRLYRGSSLIQTISSSTANDGSYNWTVPTNLTATSNYRIRVTSTSNSSVDDYSDYFTISDAPFITVTSPSSGDNWQKGSSHTIQWSSNAGGNVQIRLYRGSSLIQTISSSTANDGSFSWTAPTDLTAATNYRIRVTSTSNSTVDAYSDYFSISEALYITVTSPSSGDDWQMGTAHAIQWSSNAGGNVQIRLYRGTSYQRTIVNSASNDGSYIWSVPTDLTTASNYRIRITSTSNSSIEDYSDYFTISEIEEIVLISPNGGENCTVGTQYEIRWQQTGISSVKVEYSSDNENSWKPITYDLIITNLKVASNKTYEWFKLFENDKMYLDRNYTFSSIPEPLRGQYALRTANDDKFSNTSDADFISFDVNQNVTIYVIYTTVNTDLEKTWLNNSNGWTLESYTVGTTLPSADESNRKVRKKYFISGRIELPGNGSTTNASSMYNVVVIPYMSTNKMAQTLSGNSDTYLWTVPNDLSTQCKVRVSDASDGHPSDISDNTFTISEAPFIIVTPVNRDVLATAGSTKFSVANTGGGTMNWTASVTNGSSWLSITSGGSGTNNGTIAVAYTANTGTSPRTGTITVTASGATGSPKSVTVTQEAAPIFADGIRPVCPTTVSGILNTEFDLYVEVQNVTNLFGISFVLNFNGAYLNAVSEAPGAFIGNDVVFVPQHDNTNATVSIGISRKSGQSGVSGTGNVAKIRFKIVQDVIQDTQVDFTLSSIDANDPSGTPIVFQQTGLCTTTLTYHLLPPANVSASDGTYTDKVKIIWDSVPGASHYRIYRNTSDNSSSATALGSWQSGRSYDDFSAISGLTYYYWVKAATNSLGENPSDFSSSDTGYRSGLIVWPGDTNNDGIANQADVLPIGLYWQKTGPSRPNRSTAWVGQTCLPWQPQQATYADANGDGVVNQTDVLSVGLNYGRSHGTISLAKTTADSVNTLSMLMAESLGILINGETTPGQDFFIDIVVSEVTNLFGLSFELVYTPTTFIEPLSAKAGQGNLLGDDIIFFPNIDTTGGKVSIGISRKAGQGGVNGSGLVSHIAVRMSNDAVVGQDTSWLSIDNVQANDPDGNAIQFDVVNVTLVPLVTDIEIAINNTMPDAFALYANYPNPFNPSTKISYDLAKSVKVTIEIFDILGRHVRTLINESQQSGRYFIIWDGKDEKGKVVANGIYIYRFRAWNFMQSRKMLLLR